MAFIKSEAFGVELPESAGPDAGSKIAAAIADLGPPPQGDDAVKAWRGKFPAAVGKAIDVRVPGVDLSNLRNAALALGAGGVGYYPVSNFVHVDTGRVRQWRGA